MPSASYRSLIGTPALLLIISEEAGNNRIAFDRGICLQVLMQQDTYGERVQSLDKRRVRSVFYLFGRRSVRAAIAAVGMNNNGGEE
mmetsp:Transcript_42086/g.127672  ORF Transcript_42086/g.127672 Transcript_42086/m.127672 type:complete len:86 (+) Transcript_42086:537-794(+)